MRIENQNIGIPCEQVFEVLPFSGLTGAMAFRAMASCIQGLCRISLWCREAADFELRENELLRRLIHLRTIMCNVPD